MRVAQFLTVQILVLATACSPIDIAEFDGGADASITAAVDGGTTVTDAGTSRDAGTTTIDAGTMTVDAGVTPSIVYVGQGNGRIGVYALDFSTAALTLLGTVAAGSGPSFLAISPDRTRLYAVDETSAGRIIAFALEANDGGLRRLNDASSAGNGPAHVSVDRTGTFVLAANYGSGTIGVLPVTDAGVAAPTDTESPGQKAHQIVADATNRFVYVPCLGTDLVAQFAFDAGVLTPLASASMSTATKAGPRHIALHPNGHFAYLINELNSTMQALQIDTSGRLSSIQTISTLPPDAGANSGAEIAVHPNGHFVFASNRGHNSIVTFRIDELTGTLSAPTHTSSGGQTPRHFTVDDAGGLMLVANQDTSDLHAFRIDPTTGTLTALGEVATPPSPKFVAIVPTR